MWKRQVIGLILLGLAEAVIRSGPVFHYRKRADIAVGGALEDLQAANVLAETVKVIGLPLILSLLSRSDTCFGSSLLTTLETILEHLKIGIGYLKNSTSPGAQSSVCPSIMWFLVIG